MGLMDQHALTPELLAKLKPIAPIAPIAISRLCACALKR